MVWVLILTVIPYHPGIGVDPLERLHLIVMSIMEIAWRNHSTLDGILLPITSQRFCSGGSRGKEEVNEALLL
jgi:hypothetical protein